ncbi:MAG: DNA-processing protein DprA [Proteobacteria bacterium]|nr:DNA-processing protein DprA [Pseudomonadota bacterium]
MPVNSLTEDTKAILLLCGVFGARESEKPLSQSEYSALVRRLKELAMRPSDLLQGERIFKASIDTKIDEKRLQHLLARGVQLGFAVEQWQRNGIWIISRSDADYPARYKKYLGEKSPPLLFGVGNRNLLKGGGLSIVGSRMVDEAGADFARNIAEICAKNNMPVVSGGAKGVDQIAMTAALAAGGASVGIIADNLLAKSVEREARGAIAEGRLLLISPYHPHAHFTAGGAMNRNKLIYALSDYALVVSAEYKKGGTWTGAVEALKHENSLPVFVRAGDNTPPGNSQLVHYGAAPLTELINSEDFRQHLSDLASKSTVTKQEAPNLFD